MRNSRNYYNSSVINIRRSSTKRRLKFHFLNIFFGLFAVALIGGLIYVKIQTNAASLGVFNDPTNYLQDKTPAETFKSSSTFSKVRDDWRTVLDSNAPNPFNQDAPVEPHGPISFDFTATGTLQEKTRTAYGDQAKYFFMPYAVGGANAELLLSILNQYKTAHNLTVSGEDLVAAYCQDPQHSNDCVRNVDQLEYLNHALSLDPIDQTNPESNFGDQRAYSYTSYKDSEVILQGREQDRLASTYAEPITYTSSTGASVYKLSKDSKGEAILSAKPNSTAGNATSISDSASTIYTTNSNLNEALVSAKNISNRVGGFIDKISTPNFSPNSSQINQSNTGNLYTTPIVFPEGNHVTFNYYYSILGAPEVKNDYDKATNILTVMHPEDQCNAKTCYDLIRDNLNPQYLKNPQQILDNCASTDFGTKKNCQAEYNRYVSERNRLMGLCGGSEPEIFSFTSQYVCSMNSVSIEPEIYNSISAPWADSINSEKLIERFSTAPSAIRLNRFAPALYTPIKIDFTIKSDKDYVKVNAIDTKEAYLPGGRLETLAGQMLKLTAENVSAEPVAQSTKPQTKIFKDAYLTSDDRTYGNGYVPSNTYQLTDNFGLVYNTDNGRQGFATLKKDQPDQKLYDFMDDIKTALWSEDAKQGGFSNNTSVMFSEGKTKGTLNGLAWLSAQSPSILGDRNQLVFFNYNDSSGQLFVSGSGTVADFAPYTRDAKGGVTGGGGVTKAGYLASRVPSVTTARICANQDYQSCYDDTFALYVQAAPEGAPGGLRVSRSVFRDIDLQKSDKATQKVTYVGSSSSDKADVYYLKASDGTINGKIFNYDDSSNLAIPNENIITFTDGGDVFFGTPEYSSITWRNQTKPFEQRVIGGVGAYVDPSGEFPYSLKKLASAQFYQDKNRRMLHLVIDAGEGETKLVDYAWPQSEAPTKDNVQVYNVPSFKNSRLVRAQYDSKTDTSYILTNIEGGRNEPKQTFIYETKDHENYKVYFKDFLIDSTKVGGRPYTWDTTKYQDIEYFKAMDFKFNNSIQFDGARGIDAVFETSDRGSKILSYMTFPYSRTSMYWGKDPDSESNKTFIWQADDKGRFKPVPLKNYYNNSDTRFVSGVVDNLVQTGLWASRGALVPDNASLGNGVAMLDNMEVMNTAKATIQDYFYNNIDDAGDIVTYAGRTIPKDSTSTTDNNKTTNYDTKYCEEKWCVPDSSPVIGDQFKNDCDPSSPQYKQIHDFFISKKRSLSGASAVQAEVEFQTLCSAAKNAEGYTLSCNKLEDKPVSMAMLIAMYLQESSLGASKGYFNCFAAKDCKGNPFTDDLSGQARCAADTILGRYEYIQKYNKLETVPVCQPATAFSGMEELFTPIDRRRAIVGYYPDTGFNALKNSCNRGVVEWQSTQAPTYQCGPDYYSQTPKDGVNWPGCYTQGSGYGNRSVPGCTTTDVMVDSRKNVRYAIAGGINISLDQLKQGDVTSQIDSRLVLTTKCFGNSDTSSSPNNPTGPSTAKDSTVNGVPVRILNTPIDQYVNQSIDAGEVGPNHITACGATTTTMIAAYYGLISTDVNKGITLASYVGNHKTDSVLKGKFPSLNSTFNSSKNCGGIQNYVSESTCQFYDADTINVFLKSAGLKKYDDLKKTYSGDELFNQVARWIDSGNPLITIVNTNNYKGYDFSHVMMVVGYSKDHKSLILNDPYNNRSLDPAGSSGSKTEGTGGYHAIYPWDSDFRNALINIVPVSN